MKAVTTDQIRELDRRTIEAGVTEWGLMLSAGSAVAREADRMLSSRRLATDYVPDALVLAYKGSNGGDAIMAARGLIEHKRRVRLALFCDESDFEGAAREHLRVLKATARKKNMGKLELVRARDVGDLIQNLCDSPIIIDGIFGTGLKRPVESPFDKLFSAVSARSKDVVAIDVPSGLNPDTGEEQGEAVLAGTTVTMGLPKIGLLKEAAIDFVGKLVVAKLPYPPKLVGEIKTGVNLIHEDDLRPMLLRRKFSAHKGDFGHALIVSGSQGLTGAADLCATACARAGAGLTTLAVSENVYPILAAACPPEVMVRPLDDATLENFSSRSNALACGCGLGQSPEAKKTVENLIRRWPTPMVLDADALNNIASDPKILLAAKAPVIITPHAGEMARLISKTAAEVNADRWEIARRFARDHRVIVVLKGARTVVTNGNELWINATGNPAMASGGVGDALSGILAGLLAQKLSPFDAARAGVYLHGCAGDLAAEKLGARVVLASDLLSHLSAAFQTLT